MTKDEIEEWLAKHYFFLNEYKIKSDLSVIINVDISLPNENISSLPFKFRAVIGHFNFENNQITTMEHCPDFVDGNFAISHNPLINLDHLPKTINGVLYCDVYKTIKDPFEYRKILYSNIGGQIVTCQSGNIDNSKEISNILNKYKNRPEYFHVAIEQLMDLGESLGFKYD